MKRHSTGADMLSILLGFFFALTGAFILDLVVPSGVWASLPWWAKGAGVIVAFVIGYMFWVWLAALFLALLGNRTPNGEKGSTDSSSQQQNGAIRVPCSKCGAMILTTTAERTGGLCRPCYKKADRRR